MRFALCTYLKGRVEKLRPDARKTSLHIPQAAPTVSCCEISKPLRQLVELVGGMGEGDGGPIDRFIER